MKLDGVSITYFENGQVSAEETFKNGNLEGISRTYYRNGSVCTEDRYKNGFRHGLCKKFDEKGNCVKEEQYSEGELIGEIIEYHYRPKGILKSKYIYQDASKRIYIISYYDWKGRLEIEKSIRDKKQDGLTKIYHKNGKTASKIKYKNGKIHGPYIEYNEKNKPVWKEIYVNGVKKRRINYYYNENGKLKKKCDYQNYIKEWDKYFNKESELTEIYREFLLHDEYIYNEKGQLIIKKRCHGNGSEETHIEYSYNPNGNLKSETHFINGNIEKQFNYNEIGKLLSEKLYFEDGKLKMEKLFNRADHFILLKTYYPTGQLKLEERFKFEENDP